MAFSCPAYDHRGFPIGRGNPMDWPPYNEDPWSDRSDNEEAAVVTLRTHLPAQVLAPDANCVWHCHSDETSLEALASPRSANSDPMQDDSYDGDMNLGLLVHDANCYFAEEGFETRTPPP
eukprot:357945-Amphidinium_carterae.1